MSINNRKQINIQRLLFSFVASVGLISGSLPAFATGPASVARNLGLSVSRMAEGQPTLAPFAHVQFCVLNPDQCSDTGGDSIVELSAQRRAQLTKVNAQINRAIRPVNDNGTQDIWNTDVASGDCEDYVLTKRKRLLRMGWSSRALRVAVAYTRGGEGHAVLVVKTTDGDLVLDNRFDTIKDWRSTDLHWVKIQSGKNPKLWADLESEPAPVVEFVSSREELYPQQTNNFQLRTSGRPADILPVKGNTTLPDAETTASLQTEEFFTIRPGAAVRVVNSATFEYSGNRYRLSGVENVSRLAICEKNDGKRYACGLRKVKALSDALRGEMLRCVVQIPGQRTAVVSCTVKGRNWRIYSRFVRDGDLELFSRRAHDMVAQQ